MSANKPLPKLVGWRPTGFAVVFCDGHTKFFDQGPDEKLLCALLSIAGGEDVDPMSY